MCLSRLIHQLRQPLVALALCALLAQQMVGFVLTASPVMAYESGFSLCLSGPPPSSDDPLDMVSGAGFCPCTVQHGVGILPLHNTVEPRIWLVTQIVLPLPESRADTALATGPPPARGPPLALHIA